MRVLLLDLAKTFGGAEVRVLAQAHGLQAHVKQCDIATIEGIIKLSRATAVTLKSSQN